MSSNRSDGDEDALSGVEQPTEEHQIATSGARDDQVADLEEINM